MKWQKILWSLLCGTALGLGGCGDDTGEPEYGPPADTTVDTVADTGGDTAGDTEADTGEDTSTDPEEEEPYMTDYGPPPSP